MPFQVVIFDPPGATDHVILRFRHVLREGRRSRNRRRRSIIIVNFFLAEHVVCLQRRLWRRGSTSHRHLGICVVMARSGQSPRVNRDQLPKFMPPRRFLQFPHSSRAYDVTIRKCDHVLIRIGGLPDPMAGMPSIEENATNCFA